MIGLSLLSGAFAAIVNTRIYQARQGRAFSVGTPIALTWSIKGSEHEPHKRIGVQRFREREAPGILQVAAGAC